METLQAFLAGQVGIFLITFVRMGTILMIAPGMGDSFVPDRMRLLFALALSLILMPVMQQSLPGSLPLDARLLPLIATEFMVGMMIGTVLRIFLSAMDVAGVLISVQSGFANAQIFNPAFASPGSIVGALLTMLTVTLLFVSNAHHVMLAGFINSYRLFPVGELPLTGDMLNLVTQTASNAFLIGLQITAPVTVIILLLGVGMGVLARMMPNMQIFTFSIPLQIILTLIILSITLPVMMAFWLEHFRTLLDNFLFPIGL